MVLQSQRENLFSQSIISLFGNAGFLKSNLHSLSTLWTLSIPRRWEQILSKDKYRAKIFDGLNGKLVMISIETIGCEGQEMIIKAE